MNTDIITLTEILGTDSVSSSRITINSNFKKLAKAVSDIQTRIDTSKNTIYINVIETESGEFAIKTTPNHTTRFKIDNAGNIYIGSLTLEEYIRTIINNTHFVDLEIYDSEDNKMNFQIFSGSETKEKSKASSVTVYYTNSDYSFTVKLNISEEIKKIYPSACIIIYDNEEEIIYQSLDEFDGYTFDFDESTINQQRTFAILWIPDTAIQETYTFSLTKIED